MLVDLALTAEQWAQIALKGSWQMLRQGLNTFDRHGAFAVPGTVEHVAAVLHDPAKLKAARVRPYQLLAMLKAATGVPEPLCRALHEAKELSVANVLALKGTVAVCPDVSGSMFRR